MRTQVGKNLNSFEGGMCLFRKKANDKSWTQLSVDDNRIALLVFVMALK